MIDTAQVTVERVILRDDAHLLGRQPEVRTNRVALYRAVASSRLSVPGEHGHSRGLAGTVWTEQTKALSL